MQKLKPSARTNKRYLLIKGTKETIQTAILDYIGILGWAKAEPCFVKKERNNYIVSIDRKELTHIRAALALSADTLTVLKVSSTLKGLKKK